MLLIADRNYFVEFRFYSEDNIRLNWNSVFFSFNDDQSHWCDFVSADFSPKSAFHKWSLEFNGFSFWRKIKSFVLLSIKLKTNPNWKDHRIKRIIDFLRVRRPSCFLWKSFESQFSIDFLSRSESSFLSSSILLNQIFENYLIKMWVPWIKHNVWSYDGRFDIDLRKLLKTTNEVFRTPLE